MHDVATVHPTDESPKDGLLHVPQDNSDGRPAR